MASIKLKGDTSGEVTISAPAVAGTTTLELPATSSTLATQNALGVRNLIINGDMRIAQRGTSVTGVVTSGYKIIDRFTYIRADDSATSQEQSTDAPDDAEYSYKITVTTPDATVDGTQYSHLRHIIEGLNTAHLRWGSSNAKTITVSFWVKSSITGTYCLGLANDDFDRQYIKEYTINSANTWEKKTITISGDTTGTWKTDNDRGINVYWKLSAGSDLHGVEGWQSSSPAGRKMATSNQVNFVGTTNATFQLALTQLEVGDTATPFEHRPYDMELARCQRYYQCNFAGSWGQAYNSTTGVMGIKFHQPMRTTPSISQKSGITRTIDVVGGTQTPTNITLGSSGSNTQVTTMVSGLSGRTTWQAIGIFDTGTEYNAEL